MIEAGYFAETKRHTFSFFFGVDQINQGSPAVCSAAASHQQTVPTATKQDRLLKYCVPN